VRHMEKGESPLEASLKGSAEISFTILSMTISLVAVFIPVLFMGGIVGRLLHEFAVTITVAVLISGFVSLSLTPMLCSMFLRPAGEQQHGRIYQLSERFFEGMLRLYDTTLKWALRRRLTTLVLSFVFFIVAAGLYAFISKGFLPSEDTGQITGFTEAAQGISFESMVEHQKKVVRVIEKAPERR
jgi:HAE1 family hydrophobic/amphiphilic exporter-1